MTFDDYKIEIKSAATANPHWRVGQTAFNVLWEHRPDLSEQLRATELDPFRNDAVLPRFFHWVRSRWDFDGEKADEAQ